jgi:hypothetical protein
MSLGFYKLENENILYAPNAVLGPDFVLLAEEKDNYTYPFNHWYWFDSEEEAKQFFNIT